MGLYFLRYEMYQMTADLLAMPRINSWCCRCFFFTLVGLSLCWCHMLCFSDWLYICPVENQGSFFIRWYRFLEIKVDSLHQKRKRREISNRNECLAQAVVSFGTHLALTLENQSHTSTRANPNLCYIWTLWAVSIPQTCSNTRQSQFIALEPHLTHEHAVIRAGPSFWPLGHIRPTEELPVLWLSHKWQKQHNRRPKCVFNLKITEWMWTNPHRAQESSSWPGPPWSRLQKCHQGTKSWHFSIKTCDSRS